MSDLEDPSVLDDAERDLRVDVANVPSNDDLQRRIDAGEISPQQADQELQQAVRREAAEHGPALDTDEDGRMTTGGFGSGQGMAEQSGNRRSSQ